MESFLRGMRNGRGAPKIVVLGMMTKMPVAGVVWQTVHYLVGFARLGYDVYYVEAHARTPSMLMEREDDDGSRRAANFIHRTLDRFGLGDRWAFHALHDDRRCYGMSEAQLNDLYRSAAMILNLHGGTEPLPEHSATGRLVYLETDPVQLQVELHDGLQTTLEFLEPHCAFFTFGENYGRPGCGLPVSDRFDFKPTRQPVVIDFWDNPPAPGASFTTVGNWRQAWREVVLHGDMYSWSKHHEFRKVLDLPRRSAATFELALASCSPEERRELMSHGWRVRDGLALSTDIGPYRDYIGGSYGEFTVAKDQNVRLRTGWFSDRSATYLAAGRPVVTQETGFSDFLPTGEGLFGFSVADEALAAVEAVRSDWAHHSGAAGDLARSHFSSDIVLGRLLDDLGLESPRRPIVGRSGLESGVVALPADLVLLPISRRPTVLAPETIATVLGRPVPRFAIGTDHTARPATSILVVALDNLVFTRMCLESVLGNTSGPYEVIVVDNGSTDATPSYLDQLGNQEPGVRVVRNNANLGFAPAVNQGLACARGDVVVVLNNDVIVPPGWLPRLTAHLQGQAVGMVGPVTNAAGNEARIEAHYRTYAEMAHFAETRANDRPGQGFEVSMLTMFCTAMRRSVAEQIGPLDERFEVGMFEDDDYALRVRAAGLRVLCADDVFVHHFGEASLGHLVPTGRHAELFNANRRRFEEKWARVWAPHGGRIDSVYQDQRRRVREAVMAAVPAGASLAVVSRGDDELLELDGRRAWHFPLGEDGLYAGHHPADSHEALAQLAAARERGVRYLVVPSASRWWLGYYTELSDHLKRHEIMVDSDDCLIVDLDHSGSSSPA